MSWKAKILKKISLYIEIVSVLEIDIKRRILKPGDKLPPQRELEDFLDVNLSTIKKLECKLLYISNFLILLLMLTLSLFLNKIA